MIHIGYDPYWGIEGDIFGIWDMNYNIGYVYIYIYLVGGFKATPLKNMTSSVGMMRFPIFLGK